MNLNYVTNLLQMNYSRLVSFTGFLVFCSIIAGLYFLITWKMKPKVFSGFKRILSIVIFIAGVVFVFDMTTSLITIFQVNSQLGFTYATPETKDGEIFELQIIRKGKTMDKAGLKSFDRILMNNVNDFYRLLITNQGKTVTITVLRDNEKIEIPVYIPQLNVPLQHVSFITF